MRKKAVEPEPEVVKDVKIITRNLPCQLKDSEKIAFGELCAKKVEELQQVVDNAKARATQFKADKEEIEAEISRTSKIVNSGFEYRDVDCEQTLWYQEGIARTVRTDTGEIIAERPLTPKEMQTALPLLPSTRFEKIEPHDDEPGEE